MHLILKDGFWFVYIPFGSMVKFQRLVELPVMPSLVLLLCKFAAFAYYVINRFIFASS